MFCIIYFSVELFDYLDIINIKLFSWQFQSKNGELFSINIMYLTSFLFVIQGYFFSKAPSSHEPSYLDFFTIICSENEWTILFFLS